MKKLIIIGIVLNTGIVFAAHDEIKLNSKIESATVFFQGAQVKKSATFSTATGFFNLVFENVSAQLDPNTIQASGKGDFIILNVQKNIKYPKPDTLAKLPNEITRKINLLQDSIEIFQFAIENNQSQIGILELQKSLISKNRLMTGEAKIDSLQLFQSAMEYFKKKLFEINKELIDLKKESRKLTLVNAAMEKRLIELQNYNSNKKTKSANEPIHQVVVSIQCTKAIVGGKISISYYVSNAGWIPSYDIRGENTTSPINITYKAKMFQNTGENWDNVKLTLSTYESKRNTTKPILPTWYLNYYEQKPYSYKNERTRTTATGNTSAARYDENEKDMDDATMSSMYSAMVETRTNVEYAMEIPYSIESGAGEQTFAIHQENLKADYYHYLVPKLEKESFLLAQITNWEELNLMPAEANIYFEGTFIGKTMINPKVLTDTLELAMGRDARVICEKKTIKDKNKINLIGTNKIKNIDYEIIVRNNRTEGINRLIIEDQVPVSTIEEIKVDINEMSKAEYNKLTGLITWQMKLSAKETKKLKVSYSIKHDKDKVVAGVN